jgi:hypothetical protein
MVGIPEILAARAEGKKAELPAVFESAAATDVGKKRKK